MTVDKDKQTIPACFDCADDATGRLDQMFIAMGQMKRIALGQTPAERAVFRKLHGAAHGRLEMRRTGPKL